MLKVGELDLAARGDEILNRRPAVGLAVGVVRDGMDQTDLVRSDRVRAGRRGPDRCSEPGAGATSFHLGLVPLSFDRQPATRNPRLWGAGALGAAAVAATATAVRGRRRRAVSGRTERR
ncbi:MAG TPA: hypothetical protein VFM54_15505 [Micromonosporaceae bacterium]|nr:hypothetical protein [Micromonosporaceae bacterium]